MTIDNRILDSQGWCLPGGRRSRVIAGCVLAAITGPALAADWSFDPSIGASWEYNDNNRLSTVQSQEVEVYGPKLDARVAIRANTPRTTFELTPRFVTTFYVEGEEDDVDNGYLRLALGHEAERSAAFLNAEYSSVVTLGRFFPSSELSGPGSDYYDPLLGNPDPGETVPLVASRNREDRLRVGPGVRFDLTERQNLELGVQYLDVSFDRDLPDYRPFTDTSLYGSYGFKTSETATLSLVASYDRFEPEDEDSTDYWELLGEWSNRWSETAEVFLRAGGSFVDTGDEGSSGSSSGFMGGAGVRWGFEVTDVFLDANQYVDPNARGDLVTRTQLRFNVARRLSEVTTLRAGARYIDDSAPPGESTFRDRQYLAGNVGFRWRMTRQFSLFGSYEYRWREEEDAISDATGNSANLGVVWEPNRR